MYIFISHSSNDAEIAQELCSVLESNGSQCFLAPRDIRSGFEYAAEIINGIDRADAMLLLLSNTANNSPHILREIERAVSKSIPIIVYKLEEVTLTKSMEYFLMSHQWLNSEKGTHKQLLNCIENLKNSMQTQCVPPTVTPSNISTSKKSNKLPIIITSAVAATVVIIASLILFFTFSSDECDSDNNTTAFVADSNTSDEPATDTQVSETTTAGDSEEDSTEETSTEETSTKDNTNITVNSDIELGDTVVFGRYNDADIYWKVIKISDDGTEAVLIARELLTFKAFSAAPSGKCYYDGKTSYIGSDGKVLADNLELQAYVKGNSDWSTSTIRTWLNSDSDCVDYKDVIPTANAMSDRKNGYNSEAGFLYNFSDEEIAAIKETTIETKGNALSDTEVVTTTDRVFLLSIDELEWLNNAGVSMYATPTAAAIEKNESPWYREYCLEIYYTDCCFWWLRDPVDGKSSECYVASFTNISEELYYPYIVAVEDFGIRPAITVDLTSDCIKVHK